MPYGQGGPSGSSPATPPTGTSQLAVGLRLTGRTFQSFGHRPAVGEDHIFLYQALGGQIAAVQAVLNKASPESFRYELQEGKLLTYLVIDPRHDQGICTLLPWGYIFTSDRQPSVNSVRIYQWSQAITFDTSITSIHRQGRRSRTNALPYIIHDVPLQVLAPWRHDQQYRVLVAPVSEVEAEYDDFVMDGQ